MFDVRLSVRWNGDRLLDDIYGFDGELKEEKGIGRV